MIDRENNILVAEHEEGKEGPILRVKGELTGSSVIQLGTFLREAANSHIDHLTLDFSQVSRFEYTGIALSLAILEFYAEDFSSIICCGLPGSITRMFKGFGIDKIPIIKVAHRGHLAISNL